MARRAKENTTEKMYRIRVKDNPNYCGIDAGGVQFAYGQAVITAGRMVDWFTEHGDFYTVEELQPEQPESESEAE